MGRLLAGLTLALIATAACKKPPPPPITTVVQPMVRTLMTSGGLIDVTGDCSGAVPPAPALPMPGALPTANTGFVGFEEWRNTFANCRTTRQLLYRTVWTYDLSNLQSLKGLVVDASMIFGVVAMPPAGSHPACRSFTGGAGSLQRLQPQTMLPMGALTLLNPPNGFPNGSTIFTMPSPWSAGTIATGVTTMANATGGGTSYNVNLKDRVIGAINAGHSQLAFMLTGSGEAPITTPAAGSTDCRTTFIVQPLAIQHY